MGRSTTHGNIQSFRRHDLRCQHIVEQGTVVNYAQLLDPPMPPLHNNPASSSISDNSIETHESPVGEERSSVEDLLVQPNTRKTVISMLAVIVLALIVVPGVVLGVLMEQVEMGISLSVAVATVVGILGFNTTVRVVDE